ncbi:unnamed protein product [Tilletia controversa]|uniref:Anaphase-promoting complex subunit 5 n=2 Tax=Tilletia TaxID=13289 RepID=A0A9N8LTV6_9BASI|nr:unnamed protein product [Tilletia controversa]CAD6938595.1 unnamed protein product [Tilletia laevis]CAD6955617.1 unnamed protein product [Tilletia caries]CAD6937206.1 unnamed protein product [Tilletia controversa]CAD6964067.1 unnamed protein product [Tilletia caries]
MEHEDYESHAQLGESTLPLCATPAVVTLYEDCFRLRHTSCLRIRTGLATVRNIMVLTTKATAFRCHSIAICARALRFFKRIAIQETKSGQLIASGTPMSVVLVWANTLLSRSGPPVLPHLARSMVLCFRSIVFDIYEVLDDHDGQTHITSENLNNFAILFPLLRDIAARPSSSSASSSSRASLYVPTDATLQHSMDGRGHFGPVGENATDVSQLKFPSHRRAESWAQSFGDLFWRIRQRVLATEKMPGGPSKGLFYLHHTLIITCKLGQLANASFFAEMVAAVLRHKQEWEPHPDVTFQVASAFAALSFLQRQSGKFEQALQTSAEVLALASQSNLETSVEGGPKLMGTLALEHGSNLRRLYTSRNEDMERARSWKLKSRDSACQAVARFRSGLLNDPSDWEVRFSLGRALLLQAFSYRHQFPGEKSDSASATKSNQISQEAIEYLRTAAQAKPHVLELYLALQLANHAKYLDTDRPQGRLLCQEAIDIYQRWASGWQNMEISPLSTMHSTMGIFLLRDCEYDGALKALTKSIELENCITASLLASYRYRAWTNMNLEHYHATLQDITWLKGHHIGAEGRLTAELTALSGFAEWMRDDRISPAAARRTLQRAVEIFQANGCPKDMDSVKDLEFGRTYVLALAWLGGIDASIGYSAAERTQLAVNLSRKLIAATITGAEKDAAEMDLVHILLFHATALFDSEARDSAVELLNECMQLITKHPKTAATTAKTVWQFRAYLFEADDEQEEADWAWGMAAKFSSARGYFHHLEHIHSW